MERPLCLLCRCVAEDEEMEGFDWPLKSLVALCKTCKELMNDRTNIYLGYSYYFKCSH